MGKIVIQGTRSFEHSENTRAEFDREVSFDGVKCVLDKLAKSPVYGKDKICYVYGMGAHPRATYVALQKKPGIHVTFFRSVLPKSLSLLSYFVASYEGLIRIDQPSSLPETFLTLMERSMVALYFMSPELETEFVRAASEQGHKFIDFGVKADPGYVLYIVDADNAAYSTGMVEIVSYGRETSPDLIPIC